MGYFGSCPIDIIFSIFLLGVSHVRFEVTNEFHLVLHCLFVVFFAREDHGVDVHLRHHFLHSPQLFSVHTQERLELVLLGGRCVELFEVCIPFAWAIGSIH